MCVRVIVSCNNQFFFSTVIIRSSMYLCLENTELMAAMKRNSFSVRVKDNAKYTNPVFPVTIALSIVEKKKFETDYRRKMYCACLNC